MTIYISTYVLPPSERNLNCDVRAAISLDIPKESNRTVIDLYPFKALEIIIRHHVLKYHKSILISNNHNQLNASNVKIQTLFQCLNT